MLLPQSFYDRPTLQVARNLLGAVLCRKLGDKIIRCKISEIEAYFGFKDLASHASRGITQRNAVMFGPPGYAYVYFTYGMHYMLNIVTERKNYPAAVLIRAVEPTPPSPQAPLPPERAEGNYSKKFYHSSLLLRGTQREEGWGGGGVRVNGPAKLTKFLHIDKSLNNIPVFTKKYGLWIEAGKKIPPAQIVRAKRVGVDYAGEYKNKLWRFYIKDSKFVSKK